MQTIAELPEYSRRVEKLLREDERQAVITYLAENPSVGVIVQGTGGIRKIRWSRQGSGKSGGVRVIYYYHNESMPLYLLTLFGKGEKANLSKAECNELAQLVRRLIQIWKKDDG